MISDSFPQMNLSGFIGGLLLGSVFRHKKGREAGSFIGLVNWFDFKQLWKDTLLPFYQEGIPSPSSKHILKKRKYASEKNRRPLLRYPCKTGNKSQSFKYIRNSHALRLAQQA